MLDSSTIQHCSYGKTSFRSRDKWQLGTGFPLIVEPNSQQGIWKSPIWLFPLDCQIFLLHSFSDERVVLEFTTTKTHTMWKGRGHYRQFTITVGWKCHKCAPLLSSGMNNQQDLPKKGGNIHFLFSRALQDPGWFLWRNHRGWWFPAMWGAVWDPAMMTLHY